MMKALIIEDETAAARNLAAILRQTAPDVEIVATLESVEESVEWLRSNPHPDLLFMDIHLADGDSFRIFDAVEITAPVVFTTAYDQYALEAFRSTASTTCSNRSTPRRCGVPWSAAGCGAGVSTPTYC